MKVFPVILLVFLAGCSSNPSRDDAKSFLETLEWDQDECGNFTISGDVDAGTSPLPFFRSKMHIMLQKEKPCVQRPDAEDAG